MMAPGAGAEYIVTMSMSNTADCGFTSVEEGNYRIFTGVVQFKETRVCSGQAFAGSDGLSALRDVEVNSVEVYVKYENVEDTIAVTVSGNVVTDFSIRVEPTATWLEYDLVVKGRYAQPYTINTFKIDAGSTEFGSERVDSPTVLSCTESYCDFTATFSSQTVATCGEAVTINVSSNLLCYDAAGCSTSAINAQIADSAPTLTGYYSVAKDLTFTPFKCAETYTVPVTATLSFFDPLPSIYIPGDNVEMLVTLASTSGDVRDYNLYYCEVACGLTLFDCTGNQDPLSFVAVEDSASGSSSLYTLTKDVVLPLASQQFVRDIPAGTSESCSVTMKAKHDGVVGNRRLRRSKVGNLRGSARHLEQADGTPDKVVASLQFQMSSASTEATLQSGAANYVGSGAFVVSSSAALGIAALLF
jgi:hypothetical protein